MVREVAVVTSNGREQRVVIDTPFAIEVDGTEYTPAVAQEVEAEFDAQNEEITDQCGRSEFLQTGERPTRMKAALIVTDNDRQNSLNLNRVKTLRSQIASDIRVTSSVYSGTVELSNILLRQSDELVQIDVGSGLEPAYSVQLQLGEESTD